MIDWCSKNIEIQVYMFELSMFDIYSMEINVRTTNTFMKRLAVQNKLSLLLKIFGLKKIHNNYFQSCIKSIKELGFVYISYFN